METKSVIEEKKEKKHIVSLPIVISLFSLGVAVVSMCIAYHSFNHAKENSTLVLQPDMEKCSVSENNTLSLQFKKVQGEISKVFAVTNMYADELVYIPIDSVKSNSNSFAISFQLEENSNKDIPKESEKDNSAELLSSANAFETQTFALIIYDYLGSPYVYYGVVLPAPTLSKNNPKYVVSLKTENQEIRYVEFDVDNCKSWKSSIALVDCTLCNAASLENSTMQSFHSTSVGEFQIDYPLLSEKKTKDGLTVYPKLRVKYRGIQPSEDYLVMKRIMEESSKSK